MMKTILKTFERISVYYLTSMILSLLVSIALDLPLKFLIKNVNSLTHFLTGFISFIIILFAMLFKDGYNTKGIELKPFLISLGLLLCFVALISTIIGHAIYISGPTVYLADYILHLKEPMKIFDPIIVNRCCLYLLFLAFIFVYAPLMIIANYSGIKFKKRKFKYIKK